MIPNPDVTFPFFLLAMAVMMALALAVTPVIRDAFQRRRQRHAKRALGEITEAVRGHHLPILKVRASDQSALGHNLIRRAMPPMTPDVFEMSRINQRRAARGQPVLTREQIGALAQSNPRYHAANSPETGTVFGSQLMDFIVGYDTGMPIPSPAGMMGMAAHGSGMTSMMPAMAVLAAAETSSAPSSDRSTSSSETPTSSSAVESSPSMETSSSISTAGE